MVQIVHNKLLFNLFCLLECTNCLSNCVPSVEKVCLKIREGKFRLEWFRPTGEILQFTVTVPNPAAGFPECLLK